MGGMPTSADSFPQKVLGTKEKDRFALEVGWRD